MTNESRILTVSYGTFSCTLEGFDDPFNTMKAIAEYFRDLAAEDRYFGAEPLQPDAAMMHRVADREVSRLVGAKAREAGLVLRKSDVDAAEERLAARADLSPAPEAAPAPAPVAEPVIVEPAIVEPTVQAVMPTGVAAKLARIRQAVSRPLDDSVTPALPEDLINAFRDEVEEDGPTFEMPTARIETEDQPATDAASRIGALLQDPEAEAAGGTVESNIFADAALSEPVVEAAREAPPDLKAEAPFIEVVDLEVEPAAATAIEPVQLVTPFRADDDVIDDMAEFEEALTEDGHSLLDDANDGYLRDGPDAVESLAAASEAEIGADAIVAPGGAIAPDTASEVSHPPADLVADIVDDVAVDALAAEDLTLEDLGDEPADSDASLLAGTGAKTQRVSSRIVRIHAEDDAAPQVSSRAATRMVSPDEAEDLARLMRQADDVMADEENRRRLESLAHLKAAVAATEADRAAGEAMRTPAVPDDEAYREDLSQAVLPEEDSDPAEVRPRRKTVSVRPQEPRPGTIRPGLVSPPPLVLVSEQRIDRITPTPETPPPAAAPAARAPAAVPTGPSHPGIESQPMMTVRTGRLTGAIGVGASLASPLVPTERVVLNRATPAPAVDTDEEDGLDEQLSSSVEAGLATFAERVGVKSLAEMLEAAAAYATCVERRELFTRPQLMRRLMASAGGKAISREDGLRSFGTLLRTGRIEKVGRGHYVLAEQSPYLAEARRFR